MSFSRPTLGAVALAALLGAGALAAAAPARVDFARDIRPVLAERCWSCHGSGEQKSGLRLDSRPAALKGGRSGPALAPGNASGSEILRRITSRDPKTVMPPGRPLEPAQVELFRSWIDSGAEWPEGAAQAAGPHWAFLPPRRPAVPAVRGRAWVKNPIDAFILSELEKKGLKPAPPADRETLIRRVSLDLTGLPPTPEETRAFVTDKAPDAYEKVVRRLLASPHYGERWAQHWLDVVRFGETNGFELDADRPQAWRYRDYVVKALNEDRPYNRFLQEQIAGDEIDPKSFELRVATGFLRAGPRHVVGGNVDPAVDRQEWLTEAVAGIGNGVMGLTIGCARCHDHKFDPLPQADYYRLQAFFAGTQDADVPFASPEQKAAYDNAAAALKERMKPIEAEIAAIEAPTRERLRKEKIARLEPALREALETPADRRTPEQKKLASVAGVQVKLEWTEVVAGLPPADRERRAGLRKRLHALELEGPQPPPMAPGVREQEQAPVTHLLVRGDPHTPGAALEPQFPAVLLRPQPDACAPPAPSAAGRRSQLAEWLTRPDHPLTGRVIVNRLWQHHFGRGLVGTPNDFGRNGQRPTHPALLDWLATTFTDPKGCAWSLKRMHYLMVTSAAYRQSSAPNPPSAVRTPQSNALLWRQNPQRLDAEALRDSILAASGTLNPQAGGPPVRVPLEPEVYDQIFSEGEPDNLWPVTPDPRQHTRRSLYLLRKRNVRLPMLAVFDQPDMMSSCAARGESVHALQAMTLMNSDFMLEQSRALARRVLTEAGGDPEAALDRLYRLTLSRAPRPDEAARARAFLQGQAAVIRKRISAGEPVARLQGVKLPPEQAAAWADLCLATLNLNEFVYVR